MFVWEGDLALFVEAGFETVVAKSDIVSHVVAAAAAASR